MGQFGTWNLIKADRLSLQVKGRVFKTAPVFTMPDFKHPDLPKRFTSNNCNLRGKAHSRRALSSSKIEAITYILITLLGIYGHSL